MTQEVKNNIKTKSLASCTSSLKKRQKMDDTEYLLATDANREHILKSVEQIEKGETVKVSLFHSSTPMKTQQVDDTAYLKASDGNYKALLRGMEQEKNGELYDFDSFRG